MNSRITLDCSSFFSTQISLLLRSDVPISLRHASKRKQCFGNVLFRDAVWNLVAGESRSSVWVQFNRLDRTKATASDFISPVLPW